MSDDKLLYYKWYPRDYLSDENVVLMSLEEEGAYRRLLDYCWIHGSIPGEIDQVSRLCRTNPEKMAEIWPAIEPCFEQKGDRLVHPRMEEEREEATRRVQSARKAAKKRWENAGTTGKDADADADADADGHASADADEKPAVTGTVTEETTLSSKPGKAPVSDLWEIWLEELGGTGRKPSLTRKRRTKLTALWREQLKARDGPLDFFRSILQTIKASDHHMSKRSYQMPESTFLNEERRDRWAGVAAGNHGPSPNGSGPEWLDGLDSEWEDGT